MFYQAYFNIKYQVYQQMKECSLWKDLVANIIINWVLYKEYQKLSHKYIIDIICLIVAFVIIKPWINKFL